MINGSVQQKDITLVNIKAPHAGTPKYIKQILRDIKGEIDSNIVTVQDVNSPLTPMNRSFRKKMNKETVTLNDILEQTDLIDIFRMFHPKAAEYTFFSSAHAIFSRITFGHKTSLNKFKKIEIIPSFFDHSGMTLEINYKKKTGKHTDTWS